MKVKQKLQIKVDLLAICFRFEDLHSFCETFKKVTEGLGFDLEFKLDNLQAIIYTALADDPNFFCVDCFLCSLFSTRLSHAGGFRHIYKKKFDSSFDE